MEETTKTVASRAESSEAGRHAAEANNSSSCESTSKGVVDSQGNPLSKSLVVEKLQYQQAKCYVAVRNNKREYPFYRTFSGQMTSKGLYYYDRTNETYGR